MTLPAELSDGELTERVGRTLRAKARSVTAPATPRPFDPTLRLPALADAPPRSPASAAGGDSDVVLPAAAGAGYRRWPRWPLPVTAAVLVLVVGCASLVLSSRDGTQVRVGTPDPTEPDLELPSTPPGVPLMPRWVPEDLAPTNGSSRTGEDFSEYGPMQLFLGDDHAGVAIELGPAQPGTRMGGDVVAVRGVEGTMTDRGGSRGDDALTVYWQEDASLTATISGLTQEEAIDFLDSLTWRSDEHAAGFAPPTESELSLVGENVGPGAPATIVYVTYSSPTGRTLSLRTVGGTGRPSSHYLIGWLFEGRRDDGIVGMFDPDVVGEISLRWPDGQEVEMEGTGLSGEEMRRVFASLAPAGPEALEALEVQLSGHLAELPLIAEATLPSGSVQRREAGDDHAACLRIGDAAPACPHFDYIQGWFGYSDSVVANFSLDGTWYVIAIASQPVHITAGNPLSPGAPGSVPVETTFDGTYHYVLARPDASLSSVTIGQDGIGSMGLPRPLGVDTG